jgi:hypothetical protein
MNVFAAWGKATADTKYKRLKLSGGHDRSSE